jgi:hypothetical protein
VCVITLSSLMCVVPGSLGVFFCAVILFVGFFVYALFMCRLFFCVFSYVFFVCVSGLCAWIRVLTWRACWLSVLPWKVALPYCCRGCFSMPVVRVALMLCLLLAVWVNSVLPGAVRLLVYFVDDVFECRIVQMGLAFVCLYYKHTYKMYLI